MRKKTEVEERKEEKKEGKRELIKREEKKGGGGEVVREGNFHPRSEACQCRNIFIIIFATLLNYICKLATYESSAFDCDLHT